MIKNIFKVRQPDRVNPRQRVFVTKFWTETYPGKHWIATYWAEGTIDGKPFQAYMGNPTGRSEHWVPEGFHYGSPDYWLISKAVWRADNRR